MDNEHQHYHRPNPEDKWWKTKAGLVVCFFLCVIVFLLVMEHWVHIYPYLPWLFLLACPLMHVFHHHGHHNNDKSDDKDKESD